MNLEDLKTELKWRKKGRIVNKDFFFMYNIYSALLSNTRFIEWPCEVNLKIDFARKHILGNGCRYTVRCLNVIKFENLISCG